MLEATMLLGVASLHASTISMSVIPSLTSVTTGEVVSVAVNIQGLQSNAPNGPSLGAYEFSLGYDSGLLTTPIVSFGDPSLGDQLALSFPSITCVGLACGGTTFPLTVAEVSLDPISTLNSMQAPAFTLATINFTALGAGTLAPFSLSNVTLSDATGSALTLGTSGQGTGTGGGLSPVPEPSTALLLPIAMGIIALFFRRRAGTAV